MKGATGTVAYTVTRGTAHVLVALTGLQPNRTFWLDWINDGVRGYTVGTVTSDSTGQTRQSSVRLFRPAEQRGTAFHLTAADKSGEQSLILLPC